MSAGGSDETSKSPQLLDLGLRVSPAFPAAATLIYALGGQFEDGSNFGSVFAAGIVIAGAALIAGVFLGLLFAIPRTREQPKSTLVPSTNLNDIADWLTKILVGLGLVQLGKVASGVESMAEAAAPALGGGGNAMTFATGLLVFSAVDGFLFGYIWTRFTLTKRLKESADEESRALLQEDRPNPVPEEPLPLPLSSEK